jgi:hypothetical protein
MQIEVYLAYIVIYIFQKYQQSAFHSFQIDGQLRIDGRLLESTK